MHVQSGYSGNDSDIVILYLPCPGSQPGRFAPFLNQLMDGLGTKHRVLLKWFGTRTIPVTITVSQCASLVTRPTSSQGYLSIVIVE